MRTCPICGSTYDAAVDFCFKDGAPLTDAAVDDAEPSTSSWSDLSVDDLEPPDAISLSNIPRVEDDEDHVATLQLPTDLVDAEELDRATQENLAPVDVPPEDSGADLPPDPAGLPAEPGASMIDPFGGHDHEKFREKIHGSASDDASGDSKAAGTGTAKGDDKAAAKTPAPKKSAAKKPAPKASSAKKPASDKPAVKAPAPRKAAAPQDDEGGGNKGILLFVGVAALLLIGVIGWQMFAPKAADPEPVAQKATPKPTPRATPTPAPTPAPTPEVVEEPAGEEEGQDPADEQPEAGDATADAHVEQPPARDDAAERRRAEQRRREQERRRAAAAAASADEPPPMPFAASSTPTPTPKPAATPTPRPAATPTPTAVAAGDPWGGSAQVADGTLEVTTNPAGAAVKIDGRARGNSPARVTLKPGQYEVRVELKDHFPQTKVVTLASGGTAKAGFQLESNAPKPSVAQGTLNVITASPAALWIDGVSRGRTPTTVTLSEGPHSFKLQIDGQPPHEESFNVKFNADGKATRFFNMAQ